MNAESIPELGLLILSANNAADLEEAMKILALIQKLGKEAEPTIYVLPLDFGDATSIVNLMNQVLSRY